MSDKIFNALKFATNAHTGQYRKGTQIPYIVHPIAVMQELIKNGASEDAIAAGILHDTLEDTPTTQDDLQVAFGERITQLVIGASEPDKSLSWEERKQHTIDELSQCEDIEQLMIICADKLSNISSIWDDFVKYSDAIWGRFNRGKEQQKWYYTSLAKVFEKHIDKSPLFEKYIKMVQKIFPN